MKHRMAGRRKATIAPISSGLPARLHGAVRFHQLLPTIFVAQIISGARLHDESSRRICRDRAGIDAWHDAQSDHRPPSVAKRPGEAINAALPVEAAI